MESNILICERVMEFVISGQATILLCQSINHDGSMLLAIMSSGYNLIVINDRLSTLTALMSLSFLI